MNKQERKLKLSFTQKEVLNILLLVGRIFVFDYWDVGLDNFEGNTLVFRGVTYDFLIRHNLIKLNERPSVSTEIYGLSDKGKELLYQLNS